MELASSRLAPGDVLRVGSVGLVARKLRATLSALGIAIGIAAMVAVLAISESSKADLLSSLDRLGTNLLTVTPGQSIFGENATLPDSAIPMVGRIGPVEAVSATGSVTGLVYRSELSPAAETKGLSIVAADPLLPATVGASLADGVFLDEASSRYPAVVLGSTAARRLGIARAGGGVQILVGGIRFTVVGILEPVALVPSLDSAALVGFESASRYLDDEGDISVALRPQRSRGRRGRAGRPRARRRAPSTPTRSTSRARPTRSRRAQPRRARSRRSSSGSARSRCSSAASASRT